MASKAKSAARRVAAYERRMRRRGMVKTHVWVPKDKAARVIALARDLRAGRRAGGAGDALARAVRALRRLRPLAERLGIRHASVFGSVARGGAERSSDLDVLVEFADRSKLDLFHYLRARRELGEALAKAVRRRVDVVERGSLREAVLDGAEREAVHAF
jgi:predicted nucleotidyltransferase